jgi:hypothetical protein
MKHRRTGKRGYALITSFLMVLVLLTLGTAIMSLSMTSLRLALRRADQQKSLQIAMGATDEAVSQLKENAGYHGFEGRSLGAGTATASISTPAGQPHRRVITTTAAVQGYSGSFSKRIRATLDTGGIPPVFEYAMASKIDFTLGGSILVTSTPDLHKGNIHTNGNMSIGGTADTVDGKATATGSLTTTGAPVLYYPPQAGVPPIVFPDIDQAFKDESLVNGVASGNRTVNNGSVVRGKIVGNLTVGPPNGAQLSGVVWVTGTVTINGPVSGNGTVVCDGTMSLDASTTYPLTDTSSLMFITTNTDANDAIDLGGNRQFKGIVYAPYGTVKLHGNPELEGGIMANAITFSGNPIIRRWTGLPNNAPPMPRQFVLRGWEEL